MSDQLQTEPHDRLIREKDRKQLTTLSRSQVWLLEQKGQFPKRRKLYDGGNINVWLLSEIMAFIESREVV